MFSSLNFLLPPNPGDKALKILYSTGKLAHIIRDATCTIRQEGVAIIIKQQSESQAIRLTFASTEESKAAHLALRAALIQLGGGSNAINITPPLEYTFNPVTNSVEGVAYTENIPIVAVSVFGVYVNGVYIPKRFTSVQLATNGIESIFAWNDNAEFTLATTDLITIKYTNSTSATSSSESSNQEVGDVLDTVSGLLYDKEDKVNKKDVIATPNSIDYPSTLGLSSYVTGITNPLAQSITDNKTPTITSITSSATPTPVTTNNLVTVDALIVTALATNATVAAPTGTTGNTKKLLIRIKDDSTSRTLAFNAIYRFSSDLVAPSSTTVGKTLYMLFIYNATDNKWDCLDWKTNF